VVGDGQPLGSDVVWRSDARSYHQEILRFTKWRACLVAEPLIARSTAYVLTLTAREQHIKRRTRYVQHLHNEGLLALVRDLYVGAGKSGMKQVAELCYHKAHYAAGS